MTALSGTAILCSGLVAAHPAQAEPDLDTVQGRVDRLYHEAEIASERYNDTQIELKDLRKDLTSLQADEARQEKRLRTAQLAMEESVLTQYRGEGMASIGEVVVSEDPNEFLSDLDALSSVNDLQAAQLEDFAAQREALDLRAEATQERVDDVAAAEKRAGRNKDTIDRKLAEAKELLSDLKAEERARMASRSEDREENAAPAPAPSAAPASGRAGAAVQYALAQVGDSYVYGATGESSFDCSGLTMRAWAQAGVSLPHSSSAQMSSGSSVPSGSLQPGDLVFYYSPVSHVGIYIGNGQIVHAANPSTGVSVAPVFSMPYSGAVRPG